MSQKTQEEEAAGCRGRGVNRYNDDTILVLAKDFNTAIVLK